MTAKETAIQTTGSTPSDLLRIAVDSGADIDKLAKLMDLQERWEAGLARKAYYTALAQFQAAVPNVERLDKAHNSMYAKLDRIVGAIKGTLKDCGLTYRYEIDDTGGAIAVTCVVTHVEGHSERTTMRAAPDTSGSKNAIQAAGSTVTYMQRYTLCGALGLVSVDEDSDGGPPLVPITADQAKFLADLIRQAKFSETRQESMFELLGCKALECVPASRYQEACDWCLKAIAKAKGGKA